MQDKNNLISVWISVLYRYRKSFIVKKMEGYGSLGSLYMIVLAINNHKDSRQEQISSILKIDKGSIARSVRKLEAEGYIKREPDSSDKRANILRLTPKAEALVPRIKDAISEWENLITADIPAEDYRIIEQYMELMAKNAYAVYNANDPNDENK